MAGFTNYMASKMTDHFTNKTAYTAATAYYVGLSTAVPNDGGTVTEITGNGYARGTVIGTSWGAATNGTAAYGAAVAFPACSGTAWGTVSHFHFYDATASGTMLGWGSLGTNQSIPVGGTASFASGALTLSID